MSTVSAARASASYSPSPDVNKSIRTKPTMNLQAISDFEQLAMLLRINSAATSKIIAPAAKLSPNGR